MWLHQQILNVTQRIYVLMGQHRLDIQRQNEFFIEALKELEKK
jgi:hypothetical protein